MQVMKRLPSLSICMLIVALCLSGGFQQGYINSVLNPPYVYIEAFINETVTERFGVVMSDDVLNIVWSSLTVIFPIGSILGQMLAAWMCKRFGRKGTAIISCALCLPGTILSSLSYPVRSFEMIFIGRLLWSLGNGMIQVTCVCWVIECAPKSIRGGMGAMQEFSTAIGALVCNSVGIPLSTETLWPWMFATDVPMVFIAIILFALVPESPVSIMERTGDIDRAYEVLAKYHGVPVDSPEISTLLTLERKKTAEQKREDQPGIFWLFNPFGKRDDRLRVIQQAVWIGIGVKIAYIFSGAQTLRAYTSFFFHDMDHFTLSGANLGSWIISSLRIVATLIPVLFVDRLGRRLLMCSSMTIAVVGLAVVVAGLLIGDTMQAGNNNSIGPKTIITDIFKNNNTSFQVVSAVAFAAVILSMAGGVGSVSRFYAGELVPRSILLGTTSILAIIEDFAKIGVEFAWFPLANDIGVYSMLIFLVPSVALLLVIWRFCPETSNRSVDQVLDDIARRKNLKVSFAEQL